MPQGEVVIDPFTGHSLSREELDELLLPYKRNRGLLGDFDAPLGLFLQAAPPRDVVARMLRNLKEIHRTAEDWPRLLAVLQRLVVLLPQAWEERRDRGLTYAELGQDEPPPSATWPPTSNMPATRRTAQAIAERACPSCAVAARRGCTDGPPRGRHVESARRMPNRLLAPQRRSLATLGRPRAGGLPAAVAAGAGAHALHRRRGAGLCAAPRRGAARGAARAAHCWPCCWSRWLSSSSLLAVLLLIVPIISKELPLLREQIPLLADKLNRSLVALAGAVRHQRGAGHPPSIKAFVLKYLDANLEDGLATALSSARIGGSIVLAIVGNAGAGAGGAVLPAASTGRTSSRARASWCRRACCAGRQASSTNATPCWASTCAASCW